MPRYVVSCSLVSSRATAAARSAPKDPGAILERLAHAVRRFVEHQRARLGRELAQGARGAPAARRQESLEAEPVGRQRRDRQRRHRGAGTRHARSTSMPAAAAARTRSKPGSLMRGRARIAHQRDRRARRAGAPTSSGVRCCSLCSCSEISGVRMPKCCSRRAGMARVLGRDQAQHPRASRARAALRVAQIADRRGDHVQPPGGGICHYNPLLWIVQARGCEGMAVIARRPRLALCAALALSLLAAACSLVQPAQPPADPQDQRQQPRRGDGKHAEAARAYAQLAAQTPAEHDNYELLSAEQWVAAGDWPRRQRASRRCRPRRAPSCRPPARPGGRGDRAGRKRRRARDPRAGSDRGAGRSPTSRRTTGGCAARRVSRPATRRGHARLRRARALSDGPRGAAREPRGAVRPAARRGRARRVR